MATHSIVLAWRIPGTGEPGGLPSMGSHRVGHGGSNLAAAAAVFVLCTEVFLYWVHRYLCIDIYNCALCDPMEPSSLLSQWNSAGKNTGVGCHSLFQGISLTQGLNQGLLHCRQILYHMSQRAKYAITGAHKGSVSF